MLFRSGVAGLHQIGVETSEHSDSNGLSFQPYTVYSTSVGRGDGYVALAEVLVKPTTEDVAIFAYPSDGRAVLNNLALIGQASPSVSVQLDSISNRPDASRSKRVSCSPAGSCTYQPAASESGAVSLSSGEPQVCENSGSEEVLFS